MFTLAHWHLLLNHIPITATIFGICLLLYGILRKNYFLSNTGLITFVISGLVTIAVFNTGEGAEEIIETIGVSEAIVEAHEKAANYALWSALVLAGISFFILFIQLWKKRFIRGWNMLVLLASLVTLGTMIWTGHKGGQIRHVEIRQLEIY